MFVETNLDSFTNADRLIGKEWMLITAADREGRVNAMTASWGCLGELWNRPVAVCFIRPQRYTYDLVEESDTFSLCFFGGERKPELTYCGRESGRDGDKLKATGLTSALEDGVPYIAESKYVLICRKLYADDLKEDKFIDKGIMPRHYPENDLHRVYVCEILKVLESK